jgi:demethylmenaquinone methyltransferase/2-methoxy-6-polyprenyl-1,4-benzoquinol methylase
MAPGDRWFFGRIARVYDLVMPRADADALREGLELADGPIERVLDVGGGTGRAAKATHAPDRVVLDATAAMLRRVPPGIGRVLGSATDLPVAEGVTDAVIIVDALHHLPRHHRVLAEAHRVLRPGGVLVVREFNRATVRGRLLEAAEHALRMESTFRTAEALHARLAAAGFEGVSVLDRGFSCTVAGRKPTGSDPEPGGP